MPDLEALKAAAADRALDCVEPGMVVGLGSGTTARYFTEGLGRRVRDGLDVSVVATSRATADLARSHGMQPRDEIGGPIDLAVDGADEIDPQLQLVKGRGGALVREKLVAAAARRFIVVADSSKLVDALGAGPVPVEVLPFLWRQTRERIDSVGVRSEVRGGPDRPFISDNGNMILDVRFPRRMTDPVATASRLKQVLGVVDHGIFIGLATACIIAGADGIRVLGSLDQPALRSRHRA